MFGFSKRGHHCGGEHHEGQHHRNERMHRGGRHSMATETTEAARGGRRGRGEKMHRLFEHGDLRVVLLALLDKKPCHGYELIKAIEEASSGLYVPSPGVIYPTLTLLEEQDFVTPIATGNGRKSYQITDAGKAELQQNQQMVDVIFSRLAQVNRRPEGNLAEGISEAMHRLRHILRSSMMRSDVTPQQVEHINAALLTAVETIEKELEPKAAETQEAEKN
ncbi:transcriptional regulator PadR-like family protein [Yersinia rochesterensis]|jgi:DNA-binding PadR family transcriptional regulator|uniref:PadR family transcriptional regulator n=1 Tax=Yersinia rochesterensis TaxID=1604335 RepID=A0A386HCH2_9GAMM|nr:MULTISPECIES: PadR family transcriptional regulator [Yersinia]AJI89217.1 transcriptional regulator PadR-like family protein [Yersinia frederiksenii Y225]CNG99134.1 PadR family transcriptional regulator [Yersinia kristensenii]AIN17014.1 transcriptional regulator PadR-like family protein [Yersinia rochesterensis]AJJ37258.1 transcriptional regulator PadR-like family protein [Yersinia rochesterensis]AYD43363.1 PadR family transcriptional regulator [Yersinia rochesterensis]